MSLFSLDTLFTQFAQKRVAIVGDVMLDKYIFGSVSRISPEAPVPVIDVRESLNRLGGAANVAQNIRSLGGDACLFGVIGNDDNADLLIDSMRHESLSTAFFISDHSRPTTTKTRVIAQNHHIVRIDSEHRDPIPTPIETMLIDRFRTDLHSFDAVILEDYNKGVLTPRVITAIIEMARSANLPITVDPKHDHFFLYQGVSVFKPNLKESREALGMSLENTDADAEKACRLLQERLKADSIVLTRSEKGITLFNDTAYHIPTLALDVADVSGAGDTVISVLTLGLAAGLSPLQATRLANVAAGIVCGEVGAVAINPTQLKEGAQKYLSVPFSDTLA